MIPAVINQRNNIHSQCTRHEKIDMKPCDLQNWEDEHVSRHKYTNTISGQRILILQFSSFCYYENRNAQKFGCLLSGVNDANISKNGLNEARNLYILKQKFNRNVKQFLLAENPKQCLFNKCLGNSSCSNNDLFMFYNNNKTTKYCETTTHKNRFLDVNQHYMSSSLIEYFWKISHGLFYYPHCCCLIFFYLPI